MSWSGFNKFLTGNDDSWSLSFKTLFSEVFKRHKKGEAENINDKSNHPRPWKWLRVMMFLIGLGAISLLNVFLVGEIAFPWTALVVAAIVPITIAVFLNESLMSEKFRFFDIFVLFLVGTTVSFLATGLLGINLGDAGLNAVIVAPIIEEIAKLIVIIATLKIMKIKRVSSAIFIGWIIGSGFQIAETLGYSTYYGFLGIFSQIEILPGGTQFIFSGTLDLTTMFVRLFFSFGMHAFWGAIHGAALIYASKAAPKKFNIGRQAIWFAFCVAMHMIWNTFGTYVANQTLAIILLIIIQLMYLPLFFFFLDSGQRDYNEYTSSLVVKEPETELCIGSQTTDTSDQ